MSDMAEYQTKERRGRIMQDSVRKLQKNKFWETWFFQRGKFELFTGWWVSCCWVQKRDHAGWSEHFMKNGIFLRGRVELFTWGWVTCCWVSKRDDAEWSENCMPRCNTLKNGHLPETKVELFTGGWVSWCWVPKRDDAENEKNIYKTDKGKSYSLY